VTENQEPRGCDARLLMATKNKYLHARISAKVAQAQQNPQSTRRSRARDRRKRCVLHRRKHAKVSVVAPDGRTMLIVVSNAPSDWRVACKFRAQLKRFARPTEILPDSTRRTIT
jgi:hypothetical protein